MNEILRRAFSRRASKAGELMTLRLFDGKADGIPGLFIDRYGEIALAHVLKHEHGPRDLELERLARAITDEARFLESTFEVKAAYLRTHEKNAGESTSRQADILWGKPTDRYLLEDFGLVFLLKPQSALHAGLYVDMRELRNQFRKSCQGKRVLNLFCYSGSLGIACAAGGAKEVCQVDSSRSALRWAAENHEENAEAYASCTMRFICDDALTFLNKEARRMARGSEPWDLVIADPPVFGRSKSSTFSFTRDLKKLLQGCAEVLARPGKLVVTTNCREYTPAMLERAVRDNFEERFKLTISALLPPRFDFHATGRDSIAMRGVLVTSS